MIIYARSEAEIEIWFQLSFVQQSSISRLGMTHSRGSSGGSNHASSGQFHAEQRETLSHSFCNHFWSHAEKRALPGSDPAELGKEGYDALMLRMREGTRTLEEMRTVYKER